MIVMKFGGTSVEDAAAISRVAGIVRDRAKQKPAVVVSALGGFTDSLVAMGKAAAKGDLAAALKLWKAGRQRHLAVLAGVKGAGAAEEQVQELFGNLQDVLKGIAALGELSPRTQDNVLSFGEMLSSVMVVALFKAAGVDAIHIDARQCIVTDNCHTKAVPLLDQTNSRLRSALKEHLAKNRVPVLGGFVGATEDGTQTTLGRGGSDFSAAIVGAALGAKKIEIWTDVEGMLTTDPRICKDARRIEVIGFEEASELAYFGAKVLHPATLIPAVESNIPVYVLNSRNPKSTGTCIQQHAPHSATTFRAIALKKGTKILNIRAPRLLINHGFLRSLFEVFEKHSLSPDLVNTSEVSVSVALDGTRDVKALVSDLKRLGQVDVENGKAIVCLVGDNIRGRVGICADVFAVVAKHGVNIHMVSQGASEINISFVAEENEAVRAVKALHAHFFEEEKLTFAAKGDEVYAGCSGVA
ncbi:aspartate kinase [Candidatus Koribacter versatilis Ellin345]|uniref:Aspartokinase n=1 Tax=Koribacter versatilis (strain Ellin345) TaxID=204669 RepID=Q1IRL6_KORVE|nr:lysine-sensitive aspartokinase 3 [Candidatus Koribacter versatilis]ABF40484.1 aspartate kinase [Candidatus Koribacter versatilis Ellin345]